MYEIDLRLQCVMCATRMRFGSPWDLVKPLDITCAKCATRYLIHILPPELKGPSPVDNLRIRGDVCG